MHEGCFGLVLIDKSLAFRVTFIVVDLVFGEERGWDRPLGFLFLFLLLLLVLHRSLKSSENLNYRF